MFTSPTCAQTIVGSVRELELLDAEPPLVVRGDDVGRAEPEQAQARSIVT